MQELQEIRIRSLGLEDPLEKEMAPYSRILAWKIPWTEEPNRLQSMGSQRVGHSERLHFHHILWYKKPIVSFMPITSQTVFKRG